MDLVAPAWAGNFFALWLLVAFAVGMRATGSRTAALLGCVALTVASCTYYAWRLFVVDDVGVRYAVRVGTFWTALAIPAGLLGGAFAQRRPEGWALPAGGFAGEAVFAWLARGRGAQAVVAFLVAVATGVATEWSPKARWVAAATGAAVLGAALVHREVLHGR